jgi:hypothetical protein
MKRSRWAACLLISVLIAALVALPPTVSDWRLNPGGIFHGPAGTDWGIVWQTGLSWFLPVFVAVAAVSFPMAWWLERRNRK